MANGLAGKTVAILVTRDVGQPEFVAPRVAMAEAGAAVDVVSLHEGDLQAKPIGLICHGPWLLIEANAIRPRMLTPWPSGRTYLANPGADALDREVVIDESIVSSRWPENLWAFCPAIVAEPARGRLGHVAS